LDEASIERRTQAIVARSIEQAERETPTDWIASEDLDRMWIAHEKKSYAIRQFIAETEPWRPQKDVKCRREWMRVDYDAIEETAREVASDEWNTDDDLDGYVAYTWEGVSFIWSACKRTDERALPFWRVEWAV
jgi:hypothetical protein